MLLQRVVVVVVTVFAAAQTDKRPIIFPGQLNRTEGEVCTSHAGKTGTCERACAKLPTQGEPRRCGIKDSAFLVCCDQTLVRNPEHITDISAPTIKFQCGKNFKNTFFTAGSRLVRSVPRFAPSPGNPLKVHVANGFGKVSETSVVGGEDAQKNAWPWMALLGTQDAQGIVWFCGGVLINEQWVLSALHCLLVKTASVVRLGEHDYNSLNEGAQHQDFGVAETVFYPGYKHPEGYHDLALLKLNSRVNIQRFMSPVCLPWGEASGKDLTEQRVTLTGWGDTQFGGHPSSILQEVILKVFPAAQCDRSYSSLPDYTRTWPRGIGQETLCAGDPAGGRDACQGDSGGPLVSQDSRGPFVLAGIVSRGYGCGHKDYPGLYANLRHPAYLDWIKKVAFAKP